MTNISEHLSPKTKHMIGDRKMRIIVVSHQEVLQESRRQIFGLEEGEIERGQILEFQSEDFLRAGGEVATKVMLHPQKEGAIQEKIIKQTFESEPKKMKLHGLKPVVPACRQAGLELHLPVGGVY